MHLGGIFLPHTLISDTILQISDKERILTDINFNISDIPGQISDITLLLSDKTKTDKKRDLCLEIKQRISISIVFL